MIQDCYCPGDQRECTCIPQDGDKQFAGKESLDHADSDEEMKEVELSEDEEEKEHKPNYSSEEDNASQGSDGEEDEESEDDEIPEDVLSKLQFNSM